MPMDILNRTSCLRNPSLPPNLLSFSLAENAIDMVLPDEFIDLVASHPLQRLDMGSNRLRCRTERPGFERLLSSNLTFLDLSYNNFRCPFLAPALSSSYHSFDRIMGLMINNNNLTGEILQMRASSLVSLYAHDNEFEGGFGSGSLRNFPSLTRLEIARNQFSFDVGMIANAPYLLVMDASFNNLTGILNPEELQQLVSLDLSNNHLEFRPNLNSIDNLFTSGLKSLSIQQNAIQPYHPSDTSMLIRTSQTSASKTFRGGICSTMGFDDQPPGSIFAYDEGLFQYSQCNCDSTHFGRPPHWCFPCPAQSNSSCGNDHFVTATNVYLITQPIDHNGASSDDPTTLNLSSPPIAASGLQLATESCLYSHLQALAHISNCKGVNFIANNITNFSDFNTSIIANLTLAIKSQCNEGSEGRLCSKCTCDASGDGPCWFPKGPICKRCSKTFNLKQSIIFIVGVLALALISLTVAMLIVLSSKRKPNTGPYVSLFNNICPLTSTLLLKFFYLVISFNPNVLPNQVFLSCSRRLLKVIFYRILHMTSLGTISIVITFIQILLQLTNWDSYALELLILVMDGSFDLRCVFPFLSDPLTSLLWRLAIPIAALILVGLSVCIAELVLRCIENRRKHVSSDDHFENEQLIINTKEKKVPFRYPALALFTSVSLTVLKFFYFGTAMSAHMYLFPSIQPFTGIKYLQNHPWIRYSEAKWLIGASIPGILIWDLLIPILFIVLCWRVRQTFQLPRVQVYFGSLFENFSRSCFWWEMVIIFKKLSIALILQGIPSTSAFQIALIICILSGVMFTQICIRPWKRKSENLLDALAALLLLGSAFSARSAHLDDAYPVSIIFFSLSVAFVLCCLLFIGYHTLTGQTQYDRIFMQDIALETEHEGDLVPALDTPLDTQEILESEEHNSHGDFGFQPLSNM